MKNLVLGMALALSIILAASASAATVPVTSLSGDFAATNPSVTLTPDGVAYGPYANGGSAGGSLYYAGANGLTLAQLTELNYKFRYNTTDDTPRGAPYLRIFLNGDANDVIFDPTECATASPPENTDLTFEVTSDNVRYDDDGCATTPPPGQAWSDVVTAHGSDVVSGIYVTQGFSGGLDASALLSELSVNGTVFDFGAPVAGPPGTVGESGTSTTTVLTTTVFVQEPAAVVKPVNLIGDDLRVIHVPRRHHERFLSARATLRGKRLPVHGRAIQVDLRNQPAGNYNVHVRARYRRANGTVHTVTTTRNLSVTQA